MKTHRMPARFCLRCGYTLDAATGINGKSKPKPDDVTVCLSCGGLSRFTDDLALEPISDEAALHDMPAPIQERVRLAREHIRRRGLLGQGARH